MQVDFFLTKAPRMLCELGSTYMFVHVNGQGVVKFQSVWLSCSWCCIFAIQFHMSMFVVLCGVPMFTVRLALEQSGLP